MPKAKKIVTAEVSSGNVFADLGLPNAEELNTKLRLCVVINKILDQRKLTQSEAAQILGVNQPKVSALKSYKLEGFSVERLMHFATALEHDVVIEIRPRRKTAGTARVSRRRLTDPRFDASQCLKVALKARAIVAWGNAPGLLRAEDPR